MLVMIKITKKSGTKQVKCRVATDHERIFISFIIHWF